MKIVMALFILLHGFLLVSWLGGGQTYRFVAIDPPETIVSHYTLIWQRYKEASVTFWLPRWERLNFPSDISIRSFRIDAGESPFDGETITFIGHGLVYLGEERFIYSVNGNRLRFSLEIRTEHGSMAVNNIWEFNHRSAAARYYEPVVWQDIERNLMPPPDTITEEEARALRYLLTIAILNFGIRPSMPYISILGIALFATGTASIIIDRRFKKLGEKRPGIWQYSIFYHAFNVTAVMHFSMIFRSMW